MGNFALSIAKYAQKCGDNMDKVVRGTVIGIGTAVTMATPVGKRELWAVNIERAKRGLPPIPAGYVGGMARGSWDYAFGAVPTGDPGTIDPTGGVSVARITDGVLAAPAAGIHYVANRLPYAQALEDGHSTQAPPGAMVALNVLAWQQFVDAEVAKLEK
jgi:hypothetical protein